MMKYTRNLDSLSIRHFIPFLFVMSLIVPILLSLIWFPFIWLSIVSLMAYAFLISIISVNIAAKQKLDFTSLMLAFFTLHFSYRSEEHTSELQSRPHLVCRL